MEWSSPMHHVGMLVHDHPATPLIIGDHELMKSWKGATPNDNGVMKLGAGEVVSIELEELHPPDVFVADDGAIWLLQLLGNRGVTMTKQVGADVLARIVALPYPDEENKIFESDEPFAEIDVTSGALTLSIAYFSTAELPAAIPDSPWSAKDRRQIVIPVPSGTYEVGTPDTIDDPEAEDDAFTRCRIRRVR